MEPVEGGQRGVVLQLGQEREVIRGDVRVGASGDAVIHQPRGVQGTEHTQNLHVSLGKENVIDHTLERKNRNDPKHTGNHKHTNISMSACTTSGKTCHHLFVYTVVCLHLEVVGVVGVWHEVLLVGALQLEVVCDATVRFAVFAVAAEVVQTVGVAQLFKVFMILRHAAVAQVFHNTLGAESQHTHTIYSYLLALELIPYICV